MRSRLVIQVPRSSPPTRKNQASSTQKPDAATHVRVAASSSRGRLSRRMVLVVQTLTSVERVAVLRLWGS